MESVISQYTESLIIYLEIIIWDFPNFDVEGHPCNIKIGNLNIINLNKYILCNYS
jgi:hypothetical protein